jgi:stearoyl-CoA desaturase (Delta-9 desaturase)
VPNQPHPALAAAGHQARGEDEYHDDIIYPGAIPFVLVHLMCFAAIWTGVTLQALGICVALYFIRMFGATAGYHRYFSHRTYKTSRVGQFLLALLAQSTAQRGVIWWAAKHRDHHLHSDTELDVHSPKHRGFLYAHMGWIFRRNQDQVDLDKVKDLTRYPELVLLERHPYLIPAALAVGCWAVAGMPGLIVGFFWSTTILFHGTFMINSLAHVHGNQRYVTGDDSRNNWWLALITMGEGWHNNHHAYQSSTRQGFRWYEIDLTYYILKMLSWTGLIWDLRDPPRAVIENERKLGRKVVESVARRIAFSFPVEPMAQRARDAWEEAGILDAVREKAGHARDQAADRLAATHLPEVPSVELLREKAREMYDNVPAVSLNDIAERARQLLVMAVASFLSNDEVKGAAGAVPEHARPKACPRAKAAPATG